jgi:hypothetical protein
MRQPKRQTVYIYDHPESKIRFMEETLAGKDWRAVLVFPDGTPAEQTALMEAKARFDANGYITKAATNEHGQRTLSIHHLGEGSKPSEIIKEMGLTQGVGHLITHPSIPLEATFGMAGKTFDHLVKTMRDPAHLNGIIYIAAEAFLMWPEKAKEVATKAKEFALPKNSLRKLGFGLFFAQSLTYLFAAKDNDTTTFDEFKSKINKTIKGGGDLTHVQYNDATDKPSEGIGSAFIRLLRRYPIEAGALFNNLGMVLYIAGTIKDRNFYRNALKSGTASHEVMQAAQEYLKQGTGLFKMKGAGGFVRDMGGAITSIVAWTFMLIRPKAKEPGEHPENQGMLSRAWDSIRQNPQVGSGLLTLASSWQRLQGAHIRNRIEPGSAKQQIRGERIYIGGDLMLLFTKNDHYGKKTGNVDTLADALGQYINKMPIILGPGAQIDMVANMSDYLLQQGIAEIKRHPKTASFTEADLRERAELLKYEVSRRVRNSYAEQLEQLGDVTAKLIQQFPAEAQPQVQASVAQGLSKLPWIYASVEELSPVLDAAIKRVPPVQPTVPPTMKSLRSAIASIVGIMPEVNDGASVAILYDVLQPHLLPKQAPAPEKPGNAVHAATRVASVQAAKHQPVLSGA